MKSPFPGIDPYIEGCRLWGDFHGHLVHHIADKLADTIPERYLVRTGQRYYVVREVEEHREAFLDIYEAETERRLVTTIEVLSPSNKRSNSLGWELYQRKRQSALLEGVNLVEIDLLRGGERMPMLSPWPDSPYAFAVARALAAAFLVWPVGFQHPLPPLPVPLLSPDPDIPLHLQPLIEAIYERFRYEQSIDYTRPLTPPLTEVETTWLKQRLKVRTAPQ